MALELTPPVNIAAAPAVPGNAPLSGAASAVATGTDTPTFASLLALGGENLGMPVPPGGKTLPGKVKTETKDGKETDKIDASSPMLTAPIQVAMLVPLLPVPTAPPIPSPPPIASAAVRSVQPQTMPTASMIVSPGTDAPAAALSSMLTQGSDLPTTDTAPPVRQALAAAAGQRVPTASRHIEPTTEEEPKRVPATAVLAGSGSTALPGSSPHPQPAAVLPGRDTMALTIPANQPSDERTAPPVTLRPPVATSQAAQAQVPNVSNAVPGPPQIPVDTPNRDMPAPATATVRAAKRVSPESSPIPDPPRFPASIAGDLQPMVVPGESAHRASPEPAAASPPAQPEAHDFATLVDRLVAAREASQPAPVTGALDHRDFGRIDVHFSADATGLNVALRSPDPDFAPAVQSASTAMPSGPGPDPRSEAGARHDRPPAPAPEQRQSNGNRSRASGTGPAASMATTPEARGIYA